MVTESDLERFFSREHRELLDELDPHRSLARELDVFGQAVLGGWCELAASVRGVNEPMAEPLLEFYAAEADGYAPDDPDPEREVVAICFGTTINGTVEDLTSGSIRLGELCESFAWLHELIRTHGGGTVSIYGTGMFQQIIRDLMPRLEIEEVAPALGWLIPWQRLAWLSECQLRGGAVLSRSRGEPLIGDEREQLTYLMRLAANQPGLANWPELARFVPRRAENLLPLSADAYRRFRRDGIPDDPALSDRLVDDIVDRRHYVLDTISVIELDELGVKRIVLAPEEHPDRTITGAQPSFHLAFLVDHAAGSFSGTITLGDEDTVTHTGHRAVLQIPAILGHLGDELPNERLASDENGADSMAIFHEAQAAVELLVLSAWRDLAVPDVRDQHYEIDRLRKAKGSGKRSARRGNLEVVRYLPRRLTYRRAAREAASREGRPEPRRLYLVSAFARRLPEGQARSADAETFAHESGIPLAAHQTVVRPHYRGGTDDERRAAMETSTGHEIRQWRSWSALDLLRTRTTSHTNTSAA
jgi:hypothetical protein